MTIFAGFKPNSLKLAKHRVAVLAYDGVVLGDHATPLEIFGRVRDAEGKPCYDVRVCGAAQEVQSEHVNLKVPWGLSMERNLGQDLSLSMIARHARTSTRTLSRRFRVQVGMTPAQWLGKARVRRVRHLLETTRLSIERIAVEVGFGSASVLREHFGSVVGISPTAYRHSFRGSR